MFVHPVQGFLYLIIKTGGGGVPNRKKWLIVLIVRHTILKYCIICF